MTRINKTTTQVFMAFVCLIFFGVTGLFCGLKPVQAVSLPDNTVPTLLVSASSTVAVAPDQARVSLAVVTFDKNLSKAQDANNNNTEKLISAVKNQGLKDDCIETTNFSVHPEYNYGKENNNPPEIVGYRVRNEISLVVQNIDKLGSILDIAVKAGANNINYISFEKADTSAEENQALAQAVLRARSKAESLATAAGMSLGKVLSISEGGVSTFLPKSTGLFRNEALDAGSGSVPINPGDMKISASISIAYELK